MRMSVPPSHKNEYIFHKIPLMSKQNQENKPNEVSSYERKSKLEKMTENITLLPHVTDMNK